MISYCLSGSALANAPEKDFASLFPLLPASLSLFSLCSSPHCGPRAGREEGSLAQGEECAPFGIFFLWFDLSTTLIFAFPHLSVLLTSSNSVIIIR